MYWKQLSSLALVCVGLGFGATSAPLADASEQRDAASIRKLLGTGADVNAAQVDGTTALHWATYNDDAETVASLVKAGAKVDALNRYGM